MSKYTCLQITLTVYDRNAGDGGSPEVTVPLRVTSGIAAVGKVVDFLKKLRKAEAEVNRYLNIDPHHRCGTLTFVVVDKKAGDCLLFLAVQEVSSTEVRLYDSYRNTFGKLKPTDADDVGEVLEKSFAPLIKVLIDRLAAGSAELVDA